MLQTTGIAVAATIVPRATPPTTVPKYGRRAHGRTAPTPTLTPTRRLTFIFRLRFTFTFALRLTLRFTFTFALRLTLRFTFVLRLTFILRFTWPPPPALPPPRPLRTSTSKFALSTAGKSEDGETGNA